MDNAYVTSGHSVFSLQLIRNKLSWSVFVAKQRYKKAMLRHGIGVSAASYTALSRQLTALCYVCQNILGNCSIFVPVDQLRHFLSTARLDEIKLQAAFRQYKSTDLPNCFRWIPFAATSAMHCTQTTRTASWLWNDVWSILASEKYLSFHWNSHE
jgi:hypothetical protein